MNPGRQNEKPPRSGHTIDATLDIFRIQCGNNSDQKKSTQHALLFY